MGNIRKIKSLKRITPKKNNTNSFSTVKNIQVIDESVADDTRPSNRSDTEVFQKYKSSKNSDVEQTIKVDRRRNEVVSKKVKKRKLPATEDIPIKKSNTKTKSHTHKTLDETTENETDNAASEAVDEDEADIKDEDIDKFCDELDDADNEQFEMWVKLVEDKLREKKK